MRKRVLILLLIFANMFLYSYSGAKKEIISIGIIKDEFTTTKINGKDINDILISMLKDELNCEVKTFSGGYNGVRAKFRSGELDLIFPVERKQIEDNSSVFSENLYSQNFYVASHLKKIKDISQLEGRTIYTLQDSSYKNYLERILKNNDVYANIVEVPNVKDYSDELIALPEMYVQNLNYKMKVGTLPSATIQIGNRNSNLLERINLALNKKYGKELSDHKEKVNKIKRKEFFLSNLTEEEREYLENLKELQIGYEENSTISHYNSESKTYSGLSPLIVNEFSRTLNIPVNIKSSPGESWGTIFEKFKRGDIDLLTLAKTEERDKDFIFSKKIFDLKMYRISSKNKNKDVALEKIGVIRNSIEHELAKEYYNHSEVMTYYTNKEMIKDFNKGKITSILSFDGKLIDENVAQIDVFSHIPMNIGFLKENEVLRNIFDKALLYLIDGDRLLENFSISENSFLEKKAKLANLYSILFKVGSVLFIFLLGAGVHRIRRARKIASLAFVDSLTNLGNRYSFDKFCDSMDKFRGITVVIDLDNFKQANDKFGHDVGDKILAYCANIFKNSLTDGEVFRISGDEYFAFLPVENFEEKLNLLKYEIEKSNFLKKYSINCSIGYHLKEENIPIAQSFRYADMAMYEAKTSKGTASFVADGKFIEKTERIIYIKENLEKAIEKEFYPAFQPKISIENPEIITGAEALARWDSPKMGFVSPIEFIPVAEEMKIIGKLDMKIAEKAIEQTKKWIEAGLVSDDFVMSFNISMETFESHDVPAEVEGFLKKYGVSGKNVELEITESIITKNITTTLEKLRKLKKLGAKLSLDDFTAGHSTAGILPVLPIDIVKFDRSLILSMGNDKEKGSLVYTSLINLIQNMGLSITAEGVEQREEYEFLKDNGVDSAQGYYFGRPLREMDFQTKFLKD